MEDERAAPPRAVGIRRIVLWYSVFLAALIPFFAWAGRSEWFRFDDWEYLITRTAGNPDDWLRPHSGHWEAIPTLVYRALWSLFGLRYLPFQLFAIVLTLIGAALLLVIMLRARTRPWLAIILTTLIVFFGDAQPNVALRITGITFAGFAIPLGITQLLLADHDGRLQARDWLGLTAGLAALLCSDVATVMILAVGIAVLVKRGWRMAAFHVVPPAVVFVTWYATEGSKDNAAGSPGQLDPLPKALHFAWILITGTFESLTRANTVGGLLLAVFVVGLVLVLRRAGAERRREAVVPCALLAAGFALALETGLGRADLLDRGASTVRLGHYMYAVAYLAFPAVGFLAEEVVRRRQRAAPVLAAVLVVMIAFNARALVNQENASRPATVQFRDTVLLMPRLPAGKHVPDELRPLSGIATPITMGWLRAALVAGRLPAPGPTTAPVRNVATMRVSLVAAPTRPTTCHAVPGFVKRRLPTGQSFAFRGASVIVAYLDHGSIAGEIAYATTRAALQWKIRNFGPALDLAFKPVADATRRAEICK